MGSCIDTYKKARQILSENHSDKSMALAKLELLWVELNGWSTMTDEDRLISLYMESFRADAICEYLDEVYDL